MAASFKKFHEESYGEDAAGEGGIKMNMSSKQLQLPPMNDEGVHLLTETNNKYVC